MNQLLGPDLVALKSELSLFDSCPVEYSIVESRYAHVQPQHGLTQGSPIEFEIVPAGDQYLDLQKTVLKVSFKVVDSEGKAIDATKNFVCLNNLGIATLFEDIQFTIGDVVVEGGSFMYPYKAMLLTLLEYGSTAQQGALPSWGFYKDTAGKMNNTNAENVGRVKRQALIAEGRTCKLSGPLFLDLFRQPRFLLSRTPLRIKLTPAKARFVLSAAGIGEGTALKEYEIKFLSAELRMRYVLPAPSVLDGHAVGLKRHNALYPHRSLSLGTFTVSQGSLSHKHENLFPGGVPRLLLVGFVSNKAFNGSMDSNPFNFEHVNLSSIGVYVNGESVPSQPLEVDLSRGDCTDDYNFLLQQLGVYLQGRDIGFTLSDYPNGYSIFAFCLGSELDSSAQMYKEGNVRLELRFSVATSKVYNVIFGGLFDKQLQLTEFREVVPGTAWK